jgi:hypothetical protein
MNARDARWFHRPGRDSLPLTGCDRFYEAVLEPVGIPKLDERGGETCFTASTSSRGCRRRRASISDAALYRDVGNPGYAG